MKIEPYNTNILKTKSLSLKTEGKRWFTESVKKGHLQGLDFTLGRLAQLDVKKLFALKNSRYIKKNKKKLIFKQWFKYDIGTIV